MSIKKTKYLISCICLQCSPSTFVADFLSYNILTTSNGVEGLEVVKREGDRISLIVSDKKMPVMEGTV